jgi:hypothetical protein
MATQPVDQQVMGDINVRAEEGDESVKELAEDAKKVDKKLDDVVDVKDEDKTKSS